MGQIALGENDMKKFLILALVALVLAPATAKAAPLAVGDLVTLSDWYNTNSGGPFQATSGSNVWLTFCVEAEEYIDFDHSFKVVGISDRAYHGGVGPAGDPLDPRTAYLYTKYLGLGSQQYDATINNAYQAAIWYIEGEGGSNNSLVAEANAAGWTSIGDIRVVNLEWTVNSGSHKKGDRAQDILVRIVPVPDGGATLTLLGFALVGVGMLRRKLGA